MTYTIELRHNTKQLGKLNFDNLNDVLNRARGLLLASETDDSAPNAITIRQNEVVHESIIFKN